MCIANWHYSRRLFETHGYQKPSNIIPLFVDIVSKNGSLLLSIPLPGHGEPDNDEIVFLNELAEWQQVNSEAIKGTRPWKIFGEGLSTETKTKLSYGFTQLKFDSTDIRFTSKGEALYAMALDWPADGKILIKSLAESAVNYSRQIRKVELLGAKSELKWTRGTQGLEIQVPDLPPCKYAFSFRILSS
jgi:alpha-L-fucosidase